MMLQAWIGPSLLYMPGDQFDEGGSIYAIVLALHLFYLHTCGGNDGKQNVPYI